MTIAAGLSLGWLAAVGLVLLLLGVEGAKWLALAVAVALPLAGIWLAALLARQSALLGEEARRIAEAAATLAATEASPPTAGTGRLRATDKASRGRDAGPRVPAGTPEPPMHLPARADTPNRREPAAPAHTPPARDDSPQQQSLPFAIEPEPVALPVADLARALDFPDSEGDEEGFRALRLALRDPRARRLVQASQDVLTLLADEGIYMDDLAPEPTRPELWRRFAAGERGAGLAALGAIHDRSSLALTAARMRADPVFRDVAHHFLRLFDSTLAQVAPGAADADLARLADSRTGRAFMLVGRSAGIFE